MWSDADWRSSRRVFGRTLPMWSDADSLEPVVKSQNIGIKMCGHERSKSLTLRFTNFEALLHSENKII
jgi:hypothetical protein